MPNLIILYQGSNMKNLHALLLVLTFCNLRTIHAMQYEKYESNETYRRNLEKLYPQNISKQIDEAVNDSVSLTMAQSISHLISLEDTIATIPSQYKHEYTTRCRNWKNIVGNKFSGDDDAILNYSIHLAISAHQKLTNHANNK